MRYIAALIGLYFASTFMSLVFSGSPSPPAVAASDEEILGTASQLLPGDVDIVQASMLASARAALQAAREEGRPCAEATTIRVYPPYTIGMKIDLPGGGQMDISYIFYDRGSTTLVSQMASISGPITPATRAQVEKLKAAGYFDKMGGFPDLG